jgi:hypothetical protein
MVDFFATKKAKKVQEARKANPPPKSLGMKMGKQAAPAFAKEGMLKTAGKLISRAVPVAAAAQIGAAVGNALKDTSPAKAAQKFLVDAALSSREKKAATQQNMEYSKRVTAARNKSNRARAPK